MPGALVYILRNESPYGVPAVVKANGTFALEVIVPGINVGDALQAAAESPTGPLSNIVTAVADFGFTSVPSSLIDGGASVVPVIGAPGEVVVIVDPAAQQVLGSGVIGPNGQVGISLNPATVPGSNLQIVVDGVLDSTFTVQPPGNPPQVTGVGETLVDGSTISGTGTPGNTVMAVDSAGQVLGSGVVDAQGNFTLGINGAVTGRSVVIIQNGVKAPVVLKSARLGSETAYLSANVFRPLQGGALSIGFKALNDDHITVKIFSLSGSLVRPVEELDVKAGAIYTSSWDGRNSSGDMIASGIYFISVHGAHQSTIKKVIVLK